MVNVTVTRNRKTVFSPLPKFQNKIIMVIKLVVWQAYVNMSLGNAFLPPSVKVTATKNRH
jgi:hypothetical protein